MNDKSRIDSALSLLFRKGLSAFLVSNIRNIRYLTGFRGSSALLLLTRRGSFFITDFRYREQSLQEVQGAEITIVRRSLISKAAEILRKRGMKRVGFEKDAPYRLYHVLRRAFVPVAVDGLVERLRMLKDQEEISLIRKAVLRAERAFLKVKPRIRPGISEMAIARRLEDSLRREGCRSLPFPIIVASGERSALPHAEPTERRLRPGDLLIVDWGGEAEGYFSDMTRTFLLRGRDLSEKIRLYRTVQRARERAVKSIAPGVQAKEIDASARGVIRDDGYGDFFGHGTGHGVGLDIHEAPRISWIGRETLREGMVFTVEPGIYLLGKGGVRIEDMVLVTGKGHRLLTGLPRKLEII